MAGQSDFERADRLSRRRARMLPVLGIFFIAQQVTYFDNPVGDSMRTVDHFRVSAWIALSTVLLLALVTGGSWFRPKAVRSLLNDEITRANRDQAFRLGFILTMASAIALYFVSLFEPLSGREAVHILLSIGIAAALIRFGMLERRAHRDG